jgi:hypothetical protein
VRDLEQELAVYRSKLPELLKAECEGKFVLIHKDQIVDFFSSYDDAIRAGYSKFGLEPFLVKQIHALERDHFISRFVVRRSQGKPAAPERMPRFKRGEPRQPEWEPPPLWQVAGRSSPARSRWSCAG